MSVVKRRTFLRLGLGLTGTVLLPQCTRSAIPLNPAQPIALPTLHTSQDGLLSVELEARYRALTLGNRQAYLLAYNGQVPGPRLEAKPGDTVRLRFTNQLAQPTNLHYHGLHISPTGSGDNVFLEIPPEKSTLYEFEIPENHPAGTFWYHPHVHGLVAEQLFGGLAGLFVIRGELDNIPEVKAAKEEFIVLKDFALDQSGYIEPPRHHAQMMGRMGGLLTANGQINPTITLPAKGLLRLRLLNASSSRFFRLSLTDHPLYLIATDGGAIATPVELAELELAPGERAEVLIKGDHAPGEYPLLNQSRSQAMMGRGGMGRGGMDRGGMMGRDNIPTTPETVATIAYQETKDDVPLPQTLISVDPLPEPQTTRRFELNHGMGMGRGMGMGQGMTFLINNRAFKHNRIDTQVNLGTVEDWEIVNTGMMAHPFHVHVNKFQILSRNGQPMPYRAWKDIVTVSPGEQVKVRMAFEDYSGQTVYHCHVLDHEDLGMMGILDIQA